MDDMISENPKGIVLWCGECMLMVCFRQEYTYKLEINLSAWQVAEATRERLNYVQYHFCESGSTVSHWVLVMSFKLIHCKEQWPGSLFLAPEIHSVNAQKGCK